MAALDSPGASAVREGDAEIIARSVGDGDVFAEIFRRHAGPLHRYVSRRLGGRVADDIVAETFHIAFRKRAAFDGAPTGGSARPWLWAIAANLIKGHRRAEVRMYKAYARTGIDPVTADHAADADDRIAAGSITAKLAGALAKLPAADRDALLLVSWGEHSYAEAAATLGIPVGTVRSRVHRAKNKIRKALPELGER